MRNALQSLTPERAERVAGHLVMASRLLDLDPELAYRHALQARRLASRLAVTREAAGVTAYLTARYAEALAELRAARRLSGAPDYLPMLADAERGLGRPLRALDLAADPDVSKLSQADRLEMLVVAAGARRDLGQFDAALLTLQVPDLHDARPRPELLRLRYAYADALLAAGRRDEAAEWFARVAQQDAEAMTDAADRLAELEGVSFLDDWEGDEGPPPGDGATTGAPSTGDEQGAQSTDAADR